MADGDSAGRPRRGLGNVLIWEDESGFNPSARAAVSAPCRRAASHGIPEGRARCFPTSECAACVLERGRDAESRSVGEGGTRIARGTAERHEQERLQIFGAIPDAAAYLQEPRADAAITPSL